MRRTAKSTLIVVLAALLIASCATTIHGTKDDQTITTRVQAALLNAPGLDSLRINVQTLQGVVVLNGTVKSKQEEEQAIATARRVIGVKDVKSNLQIQPAS